MLESYMEDLIAKYPMDFFPRKTLKLAGRQNSFSGIGRFDLLFTDEHNTNILMELKARAAKYDDADQLAKYYEALKNQGTTDVIMWLIAPSIPNSIREFLDRVGIEYTEIHENEFYRIAKKHNETIDSSPDSITVHSLESQPLTTNLPSYDRSTFHSSFRCRSKISKKFRYSIENLKSTFRTAFNFLSYIESHPDEGFWLSTATNAHLYYQDSFLAYIKLSIGGIWFSPYFNMQIEGGTTSRSNLIFPNVFRQLTSKNDGKAEEWVRFNSDDSVYISSQAPEEFFINLLNEIKRVHKQPPQYNRTER